MAKVTIDRILFATDGSRESVEAGRYAAALAHGLRSRVTLLHVIPITTIPVGTTQLPPEALVEIEKTMWDGAQAILDRSRIPFEELSVPVEGLIRRGEPVEQILEVAREEGFDLIVMASHGAGGAEKAILGSTSDGVVTASPCPVLVVRKGTRS